MDGLDNGIVRFSPHHLVYHFGMSDLRSYLRWLIQNRRGGPKYAAAIEVLDRHITVVNKSISRQVSVS